MKLVDSSVWIQFLRPKGDAKIKGVIARLFQADQMAYTCPIRFELLAGVKPNEQADLDQAFSLSHHFPFEQEDWEKAAEFERTFRSKGLNIPRNDLFVLTVAVRTEMSILCRDSHFTAAQKVLGEKLKVEQV